MPLLLINSPVEVDISNVSEKFNNLVKAIGKDPTATRVVFNYDTNLKEASAELHLIAPKDKPLSDEHTAAINKWKSTLGSGLGFGVNVHNLAIIPHSGDDWFRGNVSISKARGGNPPQEKQASAGVAAYPTIFVQLAQNSHNPDRIAQTICAILDKHGVDNSQPTGIRILIQPNTGILNHTVKIFALDKAADKLVAIADEVKAGLQKLGITADTEHKTIKPQHLSMGGKVMRAENEKPKKSEIRRLFAQALSEMFATEVPEYTEFTGIVSGSNEKFLRENPNAQVDSEHRVLAEKHGAIRVGTEEEMRTVTRIFNAFGMYPVEFYDLTQLQKGALPMIATAFRPIDTSIENSAFRMFCSMLHPDYITGEIEVPVKAELANRRAENPKFSSKLLDLLTTSETKGLDMAQAQEFITEVVNSFRINKDRPVNFALYKKLREQNDVFADIVCLGININHLTPRAYDIIDAQSQLEKKGIPMKDGGIEGPPIRDDGVNIQLNQTSRKAPGEPLFVSNDKEVLMMFESNPSELEKLKASATKISLGKDETVSDYLARIEEALKTEKLVIIEHKARFGEIESRNTSLTVEGEILYRQLLAEKRYKTDFPKTHDELFKQGLAYYAFELTEKGEKAKRTDISPNDRGLQKLLDDGYIRLAPQTYNDFLAASAAGIFKANMSAGTAGVDANVKTETIQNKARLESAMDRSIISRHDLHKAIQAQSAKDIYKKLGIAMPSKLMAECDRALNQDPVQRELGRKKAA